MNVIAAVLLITPSEPNGGHGMGWREFHEVELPPGQSITFDAVRDAILQGLLIVPGVSWALEAIYVSRLEDLPITQ